MVDPAGRRERKKAATRRRIADVALGLFLERGYDAVGVRDVAAQADVAVTTVFAHFASKEALVFEQDHDFELSFVRAVTAREPGEPLIRALHDATAAMVDHCTGEGAAPIWRMIDGSPALRDHEAAMRLRHAGVLSAAIAAELGIPAQATAPRTIARFVVDAFAVARESTRPQAALDEAFTMIEAAWAAAELPHGAATAR